MAENKRKKGNKYEDLAVEFLVRRGYRIIKRNFYTRRGEIDIIAADGEYLVFIEVKYRSSPASGYPEEAVTQQKQRRIVNAARYYMMVSGCENVPVRFDVVSVMPGKIRLIRNAFTL